MLSQADLEAIRELCDKERNYQVAEAKAFSRAPCSDARLNVYISVATLTALLDEIESSRKDMPFTTGQLVGYAPNELNQDVGSISDQAVQIRIDTYDEKGIVATVVALGDFYSQRNLGDRGFMLGERLTLSAHGDHWIIVAPVRPWHILGVRDGKPYFEHYR